MKILQLTNKNPVPPKDGGAVATHALARGLAIEGHDVTVLAMNTSKHFSTVIDNDNLLFNLMAIPVNTHINPLRGLFNLLFSRQPYNGIRFRNRHYGRELIKLLQVNTYDVIILENLYTGYYLKTIRKLSRALVIMRAHNLEHEIWSRTAELSKGGRKWYLTLLSRRIFRLEKSMINQYDALVPITFRDLAVFEKLGNKMPTYVLPVGVDKSRLSEALPPINRFSIAHLGALDWLPNQLGLNWFLKEVWSVVTIHNLNIKFHLAGRNATIEFEQQLGEYNIDYQGEIPDADTFICKHPVFIVPLFSGSGMRIKLVEYMAKGRVIITTKIGAEGIPVENRKHLLICDTAEEWIACIMQLMNDSNLVTEIAKNATTFVREKYINENLVHNFSDFLAKQLNDSNNTVLD